MFGELSDHEERDGSGIQENTVIITCHYRLLYHMEEDIIVSMYFSISLYLVVFRTCRTVEWLINRTVYKYLFVLCPGLYELLG